MNYDRRRFENKSSKFNFMSTIFTVCLSLGGLITNFYETPTQPFFANQQTEKTEIKTNITYHYNPITQEFESKST
jgi:hypothetical protein